MSTICCIKNLLLNSRRSTICNPAAALAFVPSRGVRGQKKYLVWPNDWLPFHWVKPEPTLAPELFETGDPLQRVHQTVDLEEYQDGYEFLKDRDDVPQSVKNLYKLKSADRWMVTENLKRKRMQLFRRHPLDEASAEAKIARYTSTIRSLVEVIKHLHPNCAMSKAAIQRSNSKRDTYLQKLWKMDRERYEMVVKELNIEHKIGLPGTERDPPVHRKATLRVLTTEYCDKLRQDKLDAYHEELRSKQEKFLKEKEETIEWIENQKRKYHIKESDVSGEYKSQHDTRPVHTPPEKIPPPLENI